MRIEQYQAETERITRESIIILDEVKERLQKGYGLTLLEKRGVLHSIQLLVENAIGKGKRILKALKLEIPVSGYDVFEVLHLNGVVENAELNTWKRVIGLRNAIVHEYQTIDWDKIEIVLTENRLQFVIDFLLQTS